MTCQNCHQPVEAGAAFCGNCGQSLYGKAQIPAVPAPAPQHVPQAQAPAAVPQQPVTSHAPAIPRPIPALETVPPQYAALPHQSHAPETRSLLAVLAGISGAVVSLFVPVAGIGLGIAGIVTGTTVLGSVRKRRALAGIVLSSVAVLVGIGAWLHAVDTTAKQQKSAQATADQSVYTTADLQTPCYSVNFVDRLNTNGGESCNIKAYNAETFEQSTNVYKVSAFKSGAKDAGSFTQLAKQALEKDIKSSLPGFEVTGQRVSGFAGSPAYTINARDKQNNVAVVETAVYHPVASGENIFIILHGINGSKADLSIIEGKWQWQ